MYVSRVGANTYSIIRAFTLEKLAKHFTWTVFHCDGDVRVAWAPGIITLVEFTVQPSCGVGRFDELDDFATGCVLTMLLAVER